MTESVFFQSLSFAIPALIIVGSSWCLIGFVMGNCPKHKIPSAAVQQTSASVSFIVSLLIMVVTRQWVTAPMSSFLLISGAYALGGLINFFTLQFMSAAMQRGPNGVVWSIIQSALIFPFMGGVFFFGQPACLIQWLGILSIILALFMFGFTRNNAVTYERQKGEFSWKTLAFCAFGCVAVQQNLTTAPSYFEVTAGVPSIARAIASSLGTLAGYHLLGLFHRKTQEEIQAIRTCYRRSIFWKYIIAMQSFSLVTTYLLFFPGMDIMAHKGLGGAAYPLMVGSCIVSFTLLAIYELKERLRPLQIAGLALCTVGLVAICMK